MRSKNWKWKFTKSWREINSSSTIRSCWKRKPNWFKSRRKKLFMRCHLSISTALTLKNCLRRSTIRQRSSRSETSRSSWKRIFRLYQSSWILRSKIILKELRSRSNWRTSVKPPSWKINSARRKTFWKNRCKWATSSKENLTNKKSLEMLSNSSRVFYRETALIHLLLKNAKNIWETMISFNISSTLFRWSKMFSKISWKTNFLKVIWWSFNKRFKNKSKKSISQSNSKPSSKDYIGTKKWMKFLKFTARSI